MAGAHYIDTSNRDRFDASKIVVPLERRDRRIHRIRIEMQRAMLIDDIRNDRGRWAPIDGMATANRKH
jgi:hypothetical protein